CTRRAPRAIFQRRWMPRRVLSLEVFRARAPRMAASAVDPSFARPGALGGAPPGNGPPRRRASGAPPALLMGGPAPPGACRVARQPQPASRATLPRRGDEAEACAKAICRYVVETYGKFPGTVDPMHLPWFMQVHHLDLAFYDAMFVGGVYGLTHREHMARWHG